MSFRTATDAVRDFRQGIARILSCVSDAHVTAPTRGAGLDSALLLSANGGLPIAFTAPQRVNLLLSLEYRIEEEERRRWRIRTTKYIYALREGPQEILAYHWHPETTPDVSFPHLHLEAGARVGRRELTKAHIPTGYVVLADVVLLAIRDFGVVPRRVDWQSIIARAQPSQHEAM